jgi:ATP-dependent protease ClpP protease subunit
MTVNKLNPKKRSNDEDYEEDDSYYSRNKTLPYGVKQNVSCEYRVALDEDIKGPDYYRNIVAVLDEANEQDSIEFFINSPGGRLDGLMSLLDGLLRTQATTIARIVGDCASAASIFALSCDMVEVGPHAEMLCHTVRHGQGGKSPDVESAALFRSRQTKNLLKTVYNNFLSSEEIEAVIQGRELYLDSEEISERLQKRQDILQKQYEEANIVQDDVIPEVKPKARKKL